MSSSDQSDDLLCSDGDGVYDISFFAASIGHTATLSRAVNRRLEGQMSKRAPQWRASSDADRKAYLLELHEASHHALMYSTPAGVLLWRLNQVISRDISWIFGKLAQLDIVLTTHKTLEAQLTDPEWQADFAGNAAVEPGVRSHVLNVSRSLSDLILMRSIFFGRNAARTHADLTFGMLAPLLERCFLYLAERCDVQFVTRWRTRLPEQTRVFPPEKAFNVMDIAEVHAIAAELFALRAFGDVEGFSKRKTQAEAGPFAAAFASAVAATRHVNQLGLSPHQMQIAALIACSAPLDVSSETGLAYLEETLPWWRFASRSILESALVMDALRQCMSLAGATLIGQGSGWLKFLDHDEIAEPAENPEAYTRYLAALTTSLSALGLDLQVHALHQGLSLNWRFLLTLVVGSNPPPNVPKFDRLSDQSWRSALLLAIPLLEYNDSLLFHGPDLDEIYAQDNPLRQMRMFKKFKQRDYQLLAHLLNGAAARTNYAAYAGKLIPRSEVLHPKIAKALGTRAAADLICTVLAHLFESGAGVSIAPMHLSVVPQTLPRERYI